MSQAPSMPMYWDAYIADTTHLTTEEHGAYLLLLAAMWRRNGTVPDDDKDIARIVGLTKAKWIKVRARIAPLLTFDDDHISQKNLLKIWKNTQEKIANNRENGALGGRPVSIKTKDLAKANGSISHNPNVTIPEPEPNIKRDSKESQDAKACEILSQIVSKREAQDFVSHRRSLKKPMTEQAANAIVKKLSGHHDPGGVLTDSIANGWQGVFPEKIKPNSQKMEKPSGQDIAERVASRFEQMDRGQDTDTSVALFPARHTIGRD